MTARLKNQFVTFCASIGVGCSPGLDRTMPMTEMMENPAFSEYVSRFMSHTAQTSKPPLSSGADLANMVSVQCVHLFLAKLQLIVQPLRSCKFLFAA